MKNLFGSIIALAYIIGAALVIISVYGFRDEPLDDPETQAEGWE